MEGPVGRIGLPLDDRPCLRLRASGVEFHVAESLLEALPPEGGAIGMLMGDYGRRNLWFRRAAPGTTKA